MKVAYVEPRTFNLAVNVYLQEHAAELFEQVAEIIRSIPALSAMAE